MSLKFLTATTLALSLSSIGAIAAGSDSNNPPKPTATTKECKKGKVWNKDKKRCVKIEQSNLDDNRIYENARELAYDGQYENALKLLELAANPSDPRILNYKGYTNRKMGNTKTAMEYYQQALDIDPDYILARSYFGQAKMQNGDIAGAKEQLALIAGISGTDNWPYKSLFKALQGENKWDY
jgi:tetratricopeptide (TPR) repeat protein